jgi:phosphoribosylformylglycinamidine synthase I
MKRPLIAVVSFPGNNCEVESMRSVRRAGMDALHFRWNDDRAKLEDVDGYFITGGFSYEDRGRSGMVAGRDPLMEFIGREAEQGKVVIGNCNGAQILVESGLIPLDKGLRMSLAHNVLEQEGRPVSVGYISEWVWITPSCPKDRCASADWTGPMHLPIAHGEGRFTTRDKDLLEDMRRNNQLAFSYCDADGNISEDPVVTPNGSVYAAAGICNPAGNVVALMPHPERTDNGDPYFASVRRWLENRHASLAAPTLAAPMIAAVGKREPRLTELFIETIIVNNEERTVEQTARRYAPSLRLKQWKYLAVSEESLGGVLADLTVFNPRKERALIRRGKAFSRWDGDAKRELALSDNDKHALLSGVVLLRRDLPDTGEGRYGDGSQSGVCYGCQGAGTALLSDRRLLDIFCNPHAGTLETITF